MACVNALRIYAICAVRARRARPRSRAWRRWRSVFFGLAGACMAWSFWCLYTVVGPEREFKRRHSDGPRGALSDG